MAVKRITIRGPFHGIMTDVPPCTDQQGFEDVVNHLLWKGRLRIRPGLNLTSKLVPPNGEFPLNMVSFQDIEGFFHTVVLTANNPYMISPWPTFNLLTYPTFIKALTLASGGTGYTAFDTLNIIQAGAFLGTATVLTVNGSGVILTLELDNSGYGYVSGASVPTSGGTGSGATVNITQGSIVSLSGTGLPYAVALVNNRVYFCNGSIPLSYIDGEASFKISGNVPGACRYLTANANHLIGAYWTEPAPNSSGPITFTKRVRWSDSNNFDEWGVSNPAFTSGVADLINTPDNLTGLTTLGVTSYAYRTNGINSLIPTGNGAEPFYIPNFSIAPKGVGCLYPYTLVTYGNLDYFVSKYDVYTFDGTNFTNLMDGKCNAKFFHDLNLAKGQGQVRGMITVLLDNGFPYLAYVITIPGANVSWIMNIAEGFWTRMAWQPGAGVGYYDLQFIEQVYMS